MEFGFHWFNYSCFHSSSWHLVKSITSRVNKIMIKFIRKVFMEFLVHRRLFSAFWPLQFFPSPAVHLYSDLRYDIFHSISSEGNFSSGTCHSLFNHWWIFINISELSGHFTFKFEFCFDLQFPARRNVK